MSINRFPEAKRLLVFDVCNTLFSENTTAGFVEFHCRRTQRRGPLMLVRAIRSKRSPLRLLLIACRKLGGPDLARMLLVRILAGHDQGSLARSAEGYVQWLHANRRIGPVWDVLDRVKATGDLLLASASLSPVVEALAADMGASAVCSELGFRNGRCTGKIVEDVTGRKHEYIASIDREGGVERSLFVCTDNLSDKILLEAADEAVAVVYQGRTGLRDALHSDKVTYVSAD